MDSSKALDFATQKKIATRIEHGSPARTRPKHQRASSLEENDLSRKLGSSFPDTSSTSSRAMTVARSPNPTASMPNSSRTQEKKTDAGYGFQRSPVSPYHGKVMGKGALPASPFWEGKTSTSGNRGFGSATPGRRQPKTIISPDNSPTVPKFGDWDESNPSAADGFTKVFDQVRELKQNGGGTRVASTNGPSYQSTEGCCCFRWGKR